MASGIAASRTGGRGTITGWHVLCAVIGFFAIVFAVNGYFLYAALSTYTGVVSVEPYVKGLHYNERIAAQEQQDGLQWAADLSPLVSGSPLKLSFKDRNGSGVDGLAIEAAIGRPATQDFDRPLTFVARGHGAYEAETATLEPGGWLVAIEATRRRVTGEIDTFRMRRRLWLKP